MTRPCYTKQNYNRIMTLEQILEHRRAVRKYDLERDIDSDKVKECVRLATLAPTRSGQCEHL